MTDTREQATTLYRKLGPKGTEPFGKPAKGKRK